MVQQLILFLLLGLTEQMQHQQLLLFLLFGSISVSGLQMKPLKFPPILNVLLSPDFMFKTVKAKNKTKWITKLFIELSTSRGP